MNDSLLIDTKEIGNHRIKIYYDTDAECPLMNYDMCGRYLFEYNDNYRHCLHKSCDWSDWFSESKHSLEDALRCMVCEYVSQDDIIAHYKSGKFDGVRFVYNRSTRMWELQTYSSYNKRWYTEFETCSSDLKACDFRYELIESLDKDDLTQLLTDCAKDIVFKEWSSRGYSQGDYVEGVAYVTKERYDKMCGRTDVDWKQAAIECINAEIEEISMWMWGDVKGYVLERKVSFTKHFNEEDREDEEDFEWEEIGSCWGYFMESDELINEVVFEYKLNEVV